jgi:hypothetical protein
VYGAFLAVMAVIGFGERKFRIDQKLTKTGLQQEI